ncbi:MAG: ComEC/Rec2 family competence protein [Sulfitobacter sp.]
MGGLWRVGNVILHQRGHLFGWVPVCLGLGIGGYFSLTFEPSLLALQAGAVAALALFVIARYLPETVSPLLIALALIAAGFVIAGARAHRVAEPVLGWRYYGPVEGRVVGLDRSGSDALRLTLDQVTLARVSPGKTPTRVRVSLHSKDGAGVDPVPGLRVMTTAHLSPPAGPVEPGGFDFQRHAWFARLGGVGYTRVPLLAIEAAQTTDKDLAIFRIRMAASAHIRDVLPGDVGGFGAAITTGDRSAISQTALTNLRASNLAHLLAISGLHMGLLSGFVFALLRVCFALVPPVALRVPARKISAAGALVVAAGYLALSGGNVATERAFVMVAVALVAVMLNRRAISLRAVAIAAIIVLTLWPESLMGPGFQMSFAATTALVAVFGFLRDRNLSFGPNWTKPIVAVIISSAVAGIATAPIGAAHFNTIAQYGLIANLASVPLMGAVVIPSAVLALCLAPMGLEAVGLTIMGWGLQWILGVSEFVASLDGSRTFVAGPGPLVLPILTLGFLWMVLWQGRGRVLGVLPMIAAFALWNGQDRPIGLIADNGTIVGVMTTQGRALSKEKGAGFIAQNWLENDGDAATQVMAAERWDAHPDLPKIMPIGLSDMSLVHLSGKRAVAGFPGCKPHQIIVSSVPFDPQLQDCAVYDPERLRGTGSIALYDQSGTLELRTARDLSGKRLWTNWPEKTEKEGQAKGSP